jgi:hypothetical protein
MITATTTTTAAARIAELHREIDHINSAVWPYLEVASRSGNYLMVEALRERRASAVQEYDDLLEQVHG